ncbi:MAG: UbiA family prenyltransferase, partial [Desulfurococcales archaeon]|nr:UbiA family prenyltransferase [Desulfurococcales archaeon]
IVGLAIVTGGIPGASYVVPSFLTGFFIGSSAMVLNDIVDLEIDRVNAPWRPLPAGKISKRVALYCFAALSVLGLLSAYSTGVETLLVALIAWILAVLYDVKAKKMGLPGNAIVAFNVAVPLLYGAALVGDLPPRIAAFWVMIFLSALAREIAKGIADVKGDSRAGVTTIAVTKGERVAALLSLLLYGAAVAVSPVPVMKGWVSPTAYLPLILVVDTLLIYSALRLLVRPEREVALWHKRVVLLAMLLGLIGFYLGVSTT